MSVLRNIYLTRILLYPPPFGHTSSLRENAPVQHVSIIIGHEYKDCRLLLEDSGVTKVAAFDPVNVWIVFLDPAVESEFVRGPRFKLWSGQIIGEIEPLGEVKTKVYGEAREAG